jgi:3' terminal RNA ribose 2'-O-methyltransferase Hen1
VILTVSTTHRPATDLGYLLHKHPGRAQSLDVTGGSAHVFYPEATDERCTAAVLLEVDPVGLVRGRSEFALGQYVNDRPYAASSLLAVAMQRLFRTAMAARCDARPDLVAVPLPLEIRLPSLPCRGGAELAHRLFEPLGWQVRADVVPLDPQLPEWGASRYVDLRLSGTIRLADALNHLYVLLPVLDDAKHYWVGPDEVDKLIRAGGGWLADHPDKELISHRYLVHRRALTTSALERLADVDDTTAEALDNALEPAVEAAPRMPLAVERRRVVLELLRESGARRVADLGCGEGLLVRDLLADPSYTLVVGTDVSSRALDVAARRLHLDEMSDRQRDRLRLFQSSVTYRDERLAGLDAAVLMEVVEHVDPPRLTALARTVFGAARPRTVLVTTPNSEHNVRYPGLAAGAMRHPDHRFEWSRDEFRSWSAEVAETYGYQVRFVPVGDDDPEVGPPTQVAVFTVEEAA